MSDETPAERRAREKREKQERINLVNEQERKRRQKAQDEAQQEALLNAMDDEELEDYFKSEHGIDIMELRYEMDEQLKAGVDDYDIKQGLKAIEDAQKAAKGGWFSSGNSRKAKRIIDKNKKVIQKAHEQVKKKSWCGLIFLGMVGVGGGILYGLYEAGAAIISAMG
jgi:hypothetical protein